MGDEEMGIAVGLGLVSRLRPLLNGASELVLKLFKSAMPVPFWFEFSCDAFFESTW